MLCAGSFRRPACHPSAGALTDPIIEAAPAPTCLHAALIRHEQVRDLQIPMTEREHQWFPETHVQERGCHRCSNSERFPTHLILFALFRRSTGNARPFGSWKQQRALSDFLRGGVLPLVPPRAARAPLGVQVPPGPSAWQRGKQVLSGPALPRDQLQELHCLEAALLPCRLVLSQSGGHPAPMPQAPPTCG